MLFNRKKYLQNLIDSRGNGLVKIVTGVRRCGKSFLLFNIFTNWLIEHGVDKDHIIGISLDDFRNRQLRDPETLLNHIDNRTKADGQTTYVILDEVQLLGHFVEVLLSLMHTPNLEIYVTGSNSKFLSSDVVTEFRGRGEEIHVQPLTVREYAEGTGMEFETALQNYFVFGGLPQVALLNGVEKKFNFLKEMYETTYLRDVMERNKLKNTEGMRTLLRVLASGIGSGTNPRRIANTFISSERLKIADTTIRDYIKHLEDAFLLEPALRFDVKGRKYIGTETKYYFVDMGLRNVILNFRQIEDTHIMENIIFNELRGRGFLVDVGMVDTWDRNANGNSERKKLEIDFVVNKGSQRYYIQSAFALPNQEKKEQERRPLIKIADSFKKIIIVKENIIPRRDDYGILTIGLKDFLMNTDSLDL